MWRWIWTLGWLAACDVEVDDPPATGDGDGDGATAATDCDDADPLRFPGATETCDGVDENCDGVIDEGFDQSSFYVDGDADGYGSATAEPTEACVAPSGFVEGNTDCDDADAGVFPGAPRRCDVEDGDCDGSRDAAVLVPSEVPTAQEAVDASEDGDLICLEPGLSSAAGPIVVDERILEIGSTGPGVSLVGAGARAVEVVDSTLTLADLAITGDLGGMHAEDSIVVLRSVVFDGVTCTGTTSTCEGAALFVDDGELSIADVQILDTVADAVATGGAVSLRGVATTVDGLTISGSDISGPTVNGGALFVSSGSLVAAHVALTDNTVHGGTNGVGAYFFGASATLSNWVVAGNVADAPGESADGVGLYFTAISTVADVRQVSVVGNTTEAESCEGAVYVGGAATLALDGATIEQNLVDCAVLAVGGISAGSGEITVSYTNVFGNGGMAFDGLDDPTGTLGNLSVDGLFVATGAGAWDLHLGAGSPLIDAGDPALTDADGTLADVGAYGGPGGSW